MSDGPAAPAGADLSPDEYVVCWSTDGRFVFAGQDGPDLAVTRIDVGTGKRTLWKKLSVPDPAGVWVRSPVLAPTSEAYAYGYVRWLDELYLVQGLK